MRGEEPRDPKGSVPAALAGIINPHTLRAPVVARLHKGLGEIAHQSHSHPRLEKKLSKRAFSPPPVTKATIGEHLPPWTPY